MPTDRGTELAVRERFNAFTKGAGHAGRTGDGVFELPMAKFVKLLPDLFMSA